MVSEMKRVLRRLSLKILQQKFPRHVPDCGKNDINGLSGLSRNEAASALCGAATCEASALHGTWPLVTARPDTARPASLESAR